MKIPFEALAAALMFAPKNDVRTYLNGVHVESTGDEVRVVATNGHALALTRLPIKDPKDSFTIPRETVLQALRLTRGKGEKAIPFDVHHHDDGQISIKHGTNGLRCEDVNSIRFPDYLRVIPLETSGEPGQYDPTYLHLFQKADKLMGDGHVQLLQNGPTDGALVICPGMPDFVGVVMPWFVRPSKAGDIPALQGLPRHR